MMNIDIKEIERQLNVARDEYDKAFSKLPMDINYSFKQLEEDLKPYTEKVSQLSKLYRLHCPIGELSEIPDYGDVMKMEDFVESCKNGWFIDYDGYGNYIQDDKMTDIVILPSDIKSGVFRRNFEKIIWFNR